MYCYHLECIKSFTLDGGSMPILVGEVFVVNSTDPYELEGEEDACMDPGMIFTLHDHQLENFKFVRGYNV